MSEKLYLPVSVLFAALIISGTIFFVGSDISNKFTGLALGTTPTPTGNGGTVVAQPNPSVPIVPDSPSAPVDMQALLKDAHLIAGNENAKIKIVEFSDFECPFCGRAAPTVKAVSQKYGDDVAVYYKHFPLSFHPSARPAALASECAAEQGKFAEYHDKLFTNQTALAASSLKQYAKDLGLDSAKFDQCFDTSKYSSKVDAQFAEGSSAGVNGTPTFFVNGEILVGAQPQASFEAVIDRLLS